MHLFLPLTPKTFAARPSMYTVGVLLLFVLTGLVSGCTDKEQTLENIRQGMYQGGSQMEQTYGENPSLESDRNFPSYEEYQQERNEALQKDDEPKPVAPALVKP